MGVPVGRRGLGCPRPAWPAPGATRARPRGHPCYCPAPQTGDPSAAAAPRHPGSPAWRPPGGEGRPGSGGLSGGFSAPPPPRDPAGSAPPAAGSAASVQPAGLWHLREVVTASRRRPRQNLRLLPRPALGGGDRGRSWGRGEGMSGMVWYCTAEGTQEFFLGRGAREPSGLRVPPLRASVYPFPLCPRGQGRELSGIGFHNPLPLDLPATPTNLQELKFSLLPDARKNPATSRSLSARPRLTPSPLGRRNRRSRRYALPPSLPPARAPPFSVPVLPGNRKSTRGAAAKSVSYWSAPPGLSPPAPPLLPPGRGLSADPRLPPARSPTTCQEILKRPRPHSDAARHGEGVAQCPGRGVEDPSVRALEAGPQPVALAAPAECPYY